MFASPVRRLVLVLAVAPAFVACENPVQPPGQRDEPELAAASIQSDAHTVLPLSFEGDLASADGESPTRASGLTFESGISGSGVLVDGTDLLTYRTAGNFAGAAGTVEFWIKPRWNGNDHNPHFFFTIGDALRVVKGGADNLRFILGSDDSEATQRISLAEWVANDWHHIAVPGA